MLYNDATTGMTAAGSYDHALALASVVFACKITLVHLLTARERLLTNKFVQRADESNALANLFRLIMMAVPGTGLGGQSFIDRAERVAKNCAENEPFFLLLAGLGKSMLVMEGSGTITLIQIYVAARCAHTCIYLLGDKLNSALRVASFSGGALCTLALAGTIYLSGDLN